MPSLILHCIARARLGVDLEASEMQQIIHEMLRGQTSAELVAELLLALRDKGESVSELVGAARALRANMTPISTSQPILIDTCGTGGDGSGTFNISTAAAIVVAAAGMPVAKHGNRRMTSLSGSADVLTMLGVKIDPPREVVSRCLDELGICFCFAPALHPAMRHVAEVRRKLGVRTLFNLIGPLCNPAGATHQLLGTGDAGLQVKLAAALRDLGLQHGAVVRGDDGLDEISIATSTTALLLTPQGIEKVRWSVADFGLPTLQAETIRQELAADTPEASAELIRQVLTGAHSAARDIVVVNSAVALWLAGKYPSLKTAANAAAAALDSGAGEKLLHRLAVLSHRDGAFC